MRFRSRWANPVLEDPIYTQLKMYEHMANDPILTVTTNSGGAYEGHLAGLVLRNHGAVVHLDEGSQHHVVRVSDIEGVTQTRLPLVTE